MANLFLTTDLSDGKRLSIATMTRARLSRCAEPPSDISGYFLTEEDSRDPLGMGTVVARIEGDDAAYRMGQMFHME